MGKIVVSENVTLDGVVQDPAGDEGFRVGGWVGLIGNSPQLGKLALDEALAAEAFLLGRRAPVRRDQRQQTHAPPRHPDPRGRHRLPHLPICPGRLAARAAAAGSAMVVLFHLRGARPASRELRIKSQPGSITICVPAQAAAVSAATAGGGHA